MRSFSGPSIKRNAARWALPALLAAAWASQLCPAADIRVYSRTYRGAKDQLRPGTEPDAYWKSCALDKLPGHPTSQDPQQRGPICMKWMLLWGEYLASYQDERIEPKEVERERGRRYLLRAFELLTKDLERVHGLELARQLHLHSQLEIAVNWFAVSVEKPDTMAPRAAALNYYSGVWSALPSKPQDYDVFKFKFETGERLKELLMGIRDDASLLHRENVRAAVQFFEAAYAFHRQPVPDLAGQAGAPRWIKALLRDELQVEGIGYAVWPGESGLRPLPVLPHTDLEMLLLFLQSAAAAGAITRAELESNSASLRKELSDLKVATLQDWKQRLQKRGNRLGVAGFQGDLRKLYLERGDLPAAVREQEQLCALLSEVGDRQEWAVETVRLANFRVEAKEWKRALEALTGVQDALFETSQIPALQQALELEKAARAALGLPDNSAAWTAKLETFYKDLLTSPELEKKGGDEPEQQVKQLADWLAQSGHPAPSRLPMQMMLANALRDLHQYARAEAVIRELRPELQRLKRKKTELGALGGLLEIELAEGNVGHFYSTLNEFESLSRELYGDDWLQGADGLEIAGALYRVGDLHRAESILKLQMEQERLTALREIRMWHGDTGDPARDEDLLLQARIDLEFGRREQAENLLAPLAQSAADIRTEGAVIMGLQQKTHKRVLMELAEMDTALGRNEQALLRIERVLAATKPIEEISFWVRAILARARARLALGRDAGEDAKKFEELAPHFTEYKELGAQQAAEMEIILGDYYAARNDPARCVAWLKRALALADELGAIDQRIEIYRKLGEAAARAGDPDAAVEHYRRSVSLVNSVSTTIPSDLGKVGYRAARNKATAMLVTALYDKYERTRNHEYLDQMLQAVEEGKARALSEMVFSLGGTPRAVLDLAALRAALPGNAIVLEYYIPEGVRDVVFRFVVDPSTVSAQPLSVGVAELTSRVEALKEDATASAEQYDDAAFRRKAADLGKILLPGGWASFEASGARRLFIVPAGVLYLFPFSLLADDHGHFLDESENIDIAYMPNAALIQRPPPRRAEVSRSLAFVNPGRDDDQSDFLASNAELRGQFQQAFEAAGPATLHWENAFTPRELLAEVRNTNNVFIYSHGRFIPEDPTSSYIRLSDEAGVPGMLSAANILNDARIGPGLWVLAACSTGSGQVRSGDEVLGLPRALLEKGASMVIISLWDVDMSSSWKMMTLFYRNLAGGASVSRALHTAAGTLRRERGRPFDWAPFILAGQHGFRE